MFLFCTDVQPLLTRYHPAVFPVCPLCGLLSRSCAQALLCLHYKCFYVVNLRRKKKKRYWQTLVLCSFPGNETSPESFLLHNALARKPKRIRTAFSPSQLLRLEHAFEKNHYVVGAERKQLAHSLSLTETQVRDTTFPRLPFNFTRRRFGGQRAVFLFWNVYTVYCCVAPGLLSRRSLLFLVSL